ncbi:MAG: glycosyltransferase family 2 protein, partial [Verrucomicrobiaceae bacterium]
AGFREARGEYVLILNPDTIIHKGSIEKLLSNAESHPEAGAFGCRMLNADGTYQRSAHPIPSVRSYLIAALYLRGLVRFGGAFEADTYTRWTGTTDRAIGFQAGCCLLIRRELLLKLRGFDERLFHQFEDADLCKRVWGTGYSVRFCPEAVITHIGGQNRGRYPIPVILETHRSRYRFFFKHYGEKAVRQLRWISLAGTSLRFAGYTLLSLWQGRTRHENRLQMYRVLMQWHWRINPIRFILAGEEPDTGCAPLSPPPDMLALEPCETGGASVISNQ